MSESFGNFDLVKRVKVEYTDVVISKWKSRETGLTVVHLDYEAPIVNGYFVVATEIFDDSGCPHTLEHLVFMGSEKYPYKGIIDHLANRGFSNGTNAWTDTDHTAYTVSTAGEQGFLQLLPIYVDHILYPTITKAGSVHHIDPQGKDSGVVYSEMQGRENTSGDLMALRMQRLMYPLGNAYRSETGGLMEALLRRYHGTYYVPHNTSLIVAGKLSSGTPSLLSVVQEKVEPSLIEHGQNHGARPAGWKRPFIETPSARKIQIDKPKDESMGEIIINYVGPAPNEYLKLNALDMLSTYLTSSPVAPLNKEYVEVENPLCTYIYFYQESRANHVELPIYIGSVPTEHLADFDQKLKSSLQKIVETGIDMDRMQMLINRDERQLRSKLESSKGDTFSSTVISDFLYGPEDGSELAKAVDDIKQYEELRKWTSKQWTDLLSETYIKPSSIVVIGKPSAALAKKLEEDEKARIAEQVKKLGPDGIKEVTKVLEEAKAEHDRPIPTDVLTDFLIPDVKTIAWIPVQSVQEAGKGRESVPSKEIPLATHVHKDGQPLPFFVQYDHVESDFVTVHGYFSLAKLPNNLRPLLSTYISAFFALPIHRQSGEVLTHEEVINKLDDETVSYDVGLGTAGAFGEMLRISIKVEVASYETAVAWLRDLLFGARFDKERLQVTVAKIQQSLPEMKRNGNTVLGSLWGEVMYDKSSTSLASGVLAQAEFVPTLVKQLQEDSEGVIADLETIRRIITEPSGMRFSVTGNVLKLNEPRTVWGKHFSSIPEAPLSAIPLLSDRLSDVGRNPVKKATVMSLPTIESSYVTHSTKSIKGFQHPEYPAMRVALEVLNATESYLWRYIRGSGLAYGAYVSLDLEAGLLSFSLYRSSNAVGAYKEASNVLKGLVDGTVTMDSTTLDAAKSSIVYGVTKSVSTAGRAAAISFINQALKSVPQNYQVDLLEKFQAVSIEDVLRVLKTYFLPLFDASSSVAVVVTAPSKSSEIAEGLRTAGFLVEKRELEVSPEDMEGSESESGSDSEEDSEEED
ncbi:Metalloenzyme, LuxS/M16 peptidase-like protein [Mucidula mucida]|nr:Metalloenzyme, LuxS/M16 peptidase-like protein [Mucidula mucida]